MKPIFLDTVGLLALWDVSDQWHAAADRAFQQISAARRLVCTTPFVLLECGNAAARRPYRTQVVALRNALLQQNLLVYPTADELEQAWREYGHGEVGQAGIVDQISFLIMRRLGLNEVFTNDRHFVAEGFIALF